MAWISARSTPVVGGDWRQTVRRICGELGIARRVEVLECDNTASMPLTWGMVRPRILLPAGATGWSPERREVVLSHELAHITRRDWSLQSCAELARGLYWFHPLAWFAAASLRTESERACDDSVLNSGVEASRYANQMFDLARTLKNADRGWSAALAIARPSNLERRLIAMLNPTLNRCGISRRARLLVKAAALCLLLPLAALRLPWQNLSGKLTGTVFDIGDAAVPNATIITTNQKENTINTMDMTTSNAKGNFSFNALPWESMKFQTTALGCDSLPAGHDSMARTRTLSRESAVLEQIKKPLVDALDGSEKFLNPHGVAGHLLCG